MSAFLIAAAMAATAGPDHGTTPGKTYVVSVLVCRGDPLGSRQDGTLEYLSRPVMTLTEGQWGWFQLGRNDDDRQPFAELRVRASKNVLPDGKVRLIFDYIYRDQVAGGKLIRAKSAYHDRALEFGRATTFRIAAESATNQMWAVVTVSESAPATAGR